jgi:hypothetical protein
VAYNIVVFKVTTLRAINRFIAQHPIIELHFFFAIGAIVLAHFLSFQKFMGEGGAWLLSIFLSPVQPTPPP